eukprot:CAMPEP_0167798680 /NCGR_PEP_ID=MMETSP0111_2-20121227/16492_1 /TAXON_ID=91324 /ORGANISM="Lotharella globosa, Strain CCCM811" /LENGTH=109 /DNA_ID=CAMNT_0007693219 /DNA_START=32 /DNA_END=361 /DNA_ORIENTATION=-
MGELSEGFGPLCPNGRTPFCGGAGSPSLTGAEHRGVNPECHVKKYGKLFIFCGSKKNNFFLKQARQGEIGRLDTLSEIQRVSSKKASKKRHCWVSSRQARNMALLGLLG